MNHVSIDTNRHNVLKVPSHDGKCFVIFKESSALFPAHDTINGKDWTEILKKEPPATISNPELTENSKKKKGFYFKFL